MQEAGEAAMVEARSTVLNPKYIKEMMKEGAAATGSFVETFHNSFGWEVMKPDMLEDHLWQEYKEVYVDDKLNLEIRKYFEENNPAALGDDRRHARNRPGQRILEGRRRNRPPDRRNPRRTHEEVRPSADPQRKAA
ncbi:MAG: cobaltochelatase subunit CobN [Victivallis sp.]